MAIKQETIQFRDELYATFQKRADAWPLEGPLSLELIDAHPLEGVSLASARHVESPVYLSVSEVFRRGFSSVYDTHPLEGVSLDEGDVDEATLGQVLYDWQPEASEQIAGYEVYASDATKEPRATAKTLADRTIQKTQAKVAGVAGHQLAPRRATYQWLVRLVTERKSWAHGGRSRGRSTTSGRSGEE